MRLIVSILLGVAALAVTATVGQAEDGCGGGWYWNGYRCAPYRYEPPPRYRYYRDDWRRDREHEWRREHEHERDWRREHERDWRRDDDGRRYGTPNGYYPPNFHRWHTQNGCQPAWTVQDGLCKPYVGGGYFPPDHRKWHTPNGCQPHFTVQDGLCKPYRGY